MRISVAMCTYNGEKYIKEQLNSILAQTRPIDEIVVCDDGSSDSTVAILNEVLGSSNIEYKIVRNEKNLGFIKNFEKSISLCSGDVIFFSDQDDVWNPVKVEEMTQTFENNPNCVLCYSDAVVMNSDLSEVIDSSLNQQCQISSASVQADAIDGRFPSGCTECVKASFVHNIMPFRFGHDQWVAMCAACFGDVAYIDEPLIKYRRHSSAVTGYTPNGFLQHKISRVKQFCAKIGGGGTRRNVILNGLPLTWTHIPVILNWLAVY